MNKITSIAALAAIASVSITANAVTTGITTPATTATSISVTATTDTSLVGGGLKDTVTLQLSAGNINSVDYYPTNNTYGYAVASTKGKGKIYRGASAGGAIVEFSSAAAVPTITEVATEAGKSSGSGS